MRHKWNAIGSAQFFQPPRQTQLAHAIVVPAGLVRQGAGQPGFLPAGGAVDDQAEAVAAAIGCCSVAEPAPCPARLGAVAKCLLWRRMP